jgi:aspartate/methionine/tyrosine aminotransferase
MVSAIQKRVNFCVDMLRENPYITVTRPSGAFYVLPRLDMKSLRFKNSKDFVTRALMETGVQLTGGYSFGTHSHFRIAALPPKETLEYAINLVNAFCMKHAKK